MVLWKILSMGDGRRQHENAGCQFWTVIQPIYYWGGVCLMEVQVEELTQVLWSGKRNWGVEEKQKRQQSKPGSGEWGNNFWLDTYGCKGNDGPQCDYPWMSNELHAWRVMEL